MISVRHAEIDSTRRQWLLRAYSIGIVALYGFLFLFFLRQTGPEDQDQFLAFHELQYWNTSLFGIAKQWTPLMCAGLSLAGEPQVPFMSLSMGLSYLLDPFWGLKVAMLLYFISGWTGAYLYAGLWLKEVGQRTLAAALFIGNGFFVCRFGYGHIDFIPFLTLPLMLWALHQIVADQPSKDLASRFVHFAGITLLMGAGIALVVDGSPVAIIHLLFWIGLYALILTFTTRSILPALLFACAVAIAAVMDAGYLWPMLQAQTIFPRHLPDRFTSVLSLLWFALLPVRGKFLPANGNGHELSVFIGPVIGWLLWHYRSWLAASIPQSMRQPLLVVSIVSIVLGMGSLKSLHVPMWLSPFDMLRPLPGFRSIGVTGRYWGFLTLPLSLLGAAALWRFVTESRNNKHVWIWAGGALVMQLAFQTETIAHHWANSRRYQSVSVAGTFQGKPQLVEYVARNGENQGKFLTPTRGVLDCYDSDDFIHADINAGSQLVRHMMLDGKLLNPTPNVHAQFLTWSHVRLDLDPDEWFAHATASTRIQIIMQQAFHPLWQVAGCETIRSGRGNLALDCPLSRLREGPIDVEFNDVLSDQAAAVSIRAWQLWSLSIVGLAVIFGGGKMLVAVSRKRQSQP